MIRNIVCLITIIFLTLIISSCDDKNIRKGTDVPGKTEKKDRETPSRRGSGADRQEAKTGQIEKIKKEIRKRGLKFKVKKTEALKYQIIEITGLTIPEGLEKEAAAQNSRAEKDWALYKRKYHKHVKRNRRDKEKSKFGTDDFEQFSASDRDNIATDIHLSPSPALKAFSWEDRKVITGIKNQGTCGSCWAFAAMAAFEANYIIRNNKEADLSEQHVLDCAVDRNGRKAGSCNGGWYKGVFDYLKKRNAVLEENFPYRGKDSRCLPTRAARYRLAFWGFVKNNAGIPLEREMKEALCTYGPLTAAVKVTPAFQAYSGGVFDEHARVRAERDVNHAIVITGWDDSKKAYRIKNSWGKGWGEKGYAWVEYGCNNIGYGAVWIVANRERL
ncbi:MAG: hypothetical protein GY754_25390 [bacterium]|nr:hypothetical protein [bacterium]